MPAPALLQVCAVDFTAWHFLRPLMRAQLEAGFDVHLACRPGAYLDALGQEGFTVHPIPFERSYDLLAHWRAARALRKLLRREPFTVVHAHTPIASLIARRVARRCRVPVVLYTAHGFYFHDAMAPRARRFHIALERWGQRHADFLFTQSREDLETAVREGIAPAARARAIGNGVDIDRFRQWRFSAEERAATRAELGLAPDAGPIVMMIGRLVREKGYFEFLEAFARAREELPAARAVLIGEALASDHDASAAEIFARAEALGLKDSVIFTGARRDIPRLLAIADVYCLPSWREGMPRSIIEAMAMTLPVVTTDIRGCREEVVDGETGRIVPARDSAALAGALLELLRDEALRRQMGAAARRRAVQLYDERKVIAAQMEVMQRLFAEKGLAWPTPEA